MTREQIKNHFILRRDLKEAREILKSLREAATPGAQALTGMPHAPGVNDKTGNLAAEIVDMESEIRKLKAKIAEQEPEIEEFIQGIRSGKIRTIFRLRLLNGFSWKEVSAILGKWSTADSVSATYYAYLNKNKIR